MSMHESNGGKDSSLSWSLGVLLPQKSMRNLSTLVRWCTSVKIWF